MAFWVYILRNPDGITYIGQTSCLEKRLEQHNNPDYRGTLFTKRHRLPWIIIHSEQFETRSLAMKRERELKSGKGRDWIKRNVNADGC